MTELNDVLRNASEDVQRLNADKLRAVRSVTGQPTTMLILIPDYTCPTMNQLYEQKHWSGRKKMADAVHYLVRIYAPSLPEPLQGPVRIEIVAYRKRLIDADNIPAKLLIDGLRLAGVLCDDSKKYVDSVTTRCEQGEPRVEIVIRGIEAQHDN